MSAQDRRQPRDGVADGAEVAAGRLSPERCLYLLETQSLGRLSFTVGALPAIAPVGYWLSDDQICLRLGVRRWLPDLRQSTVVLLQVDEVSPHSLSGWQVTVTGLLSDLPAGDMAPPPSEVIAGHPVLGDPDLYLRPHIIVGHAVQLTP